MGVDTTITYPSAEHKEISFPILMYRRSDGLIVKMFYRSFGQSSAFGVPLNNDDWQTPSQYRCTWELGEFVPFTGSITLTNTEE
tara:strand:+ start:40632 stop:40883 length:252 start_codon:yes stop_codon:yes gene_type:complete